VRTILVVLALVCAVVVAFIGFDVVTSTHVVGWLGASLALYLGSLLVPD